MNEQRADLCLFTLRFFKTRAMAQALIEKGRLRVNGVKVEKPARKLRIGDVLVFPQGREIRSIRVLGFTEKRVGASIAQGLYENIDDFSLEEGRKSH